MCFAVRTEADKSSIGVIVVANLGGLARVAG